MLRSFLIVGLLGNAVFWKKACGNRQVSLVQRKPVPAVPSVSGKGPLQALTVHRATSISWTSKGLSVNEVWQ